MAMDFPSNPADGQISGNFIWSASSGAWKAKPQLQQTTIQSPSVPTSANAGDIWVNTNTGISFHYYDDGTSKQWVEMISSSVPQAEYVMPTGTIVQTARATAPDAWLLCQGQTISRTTYATLFSAIGTAYGSGDGSTTFSIPNLQGRVPVGKDSGTFSALGATGGTETVTLTESQIPSHTHTQSAHSHTATDSGHSHSGVPIIGNVSVPQGSYYGVLGSYGQKNTDTGYASISVSNAQPAIQNTGGGGSHNNLQPYIVLNYMIKV